MPSKQEDPLNCPSCGAPTTTEFRFCGECGTPTAQSGTAVAHSGTATAAANPQQSYPPPAAPEQSAGYMSPPAYSRSPRAVGTSPHAFTRLGFNSLSIAAAATLAAGVIARLLWFISRSNLGGSNVGPAPSFGGMWTNMHRAQVAIYSESFLTNSVGWFTAMLLCAAAAYLLLRRGDGQRFGTALLTGVVLVQMPVLVRLVQMFFAGNKRLGFGGAQSLFVLISLISPVVALGLILPSWRSNKRREVVDGPSSLGLVLGSIAAAAAIGSLFLPMFAHATDVWDGHDLGAYFTHHYTPGIAWAIVFLVGLVGSWLVPDRRTQLGVFTSVAAVLSTSFIASVFSRNALYVDQANRDGFSWSLALMLLAAVLLIIAVVLVIVFHRQHPVPLLSVGLPAPRVASPPAALQTDSYPGRPYGYRSQPYGQ